jgi:hypothetical protein
MEINMKNMTDTEKLTMINQLWESLDAKDDLIPVDLEHIKIVNERIKSNSPTVALDVAIEQIKNALK